MAITLTHTTAASVSGVSSSSAETPSYGFSSGPYFVLTCARRTDSTPPGQPTFSEPNGMTATHQVSQNMGDGTHRRTFSLFTLTGNGTGTLKATWNSTGCSRCQIQSYSAVGVSSSDMAAQSTDADWGYTNSTGGFSLAFSSTFSSTGNASVGAAIVGTTGTYTPESGYTGIGGSTDDDPIGVQYKVGTDTGIDFAFSTNAPQYAAIVFELNEAPAAAGTPYTYTLVKRFV